MTEHNQPEKRLFSFRMSKGVKESLCTFCHHAFKPEGHIVICPICHRLHHPGCWEFNKKHCALYGCEGSGEVYDPAPTVRKRLEEAIKADSDVGIAKAWRDTWRDGWSLLKGAERAKYTKRAQIAGQRYDALQRLKAAIKTNDDRRICKGFDPDLLEGCRDIREEQRERVRLACRRVGALDKLAVARKSRALAEIVQAYEPDLLLACSELSASEHATLQRMCEASSRLEQAIKTDSDEGITRICTDYQDIFSEYRITQAQFRRIEVAATRVNALRAFRRALMSNDESRIVASYTPKLLDDCTDVKLHERERLELARKRILIIDHLKEALTDNEFEGFSDTFVENQDWLKELDWVAEHEDKIARAIRHALHERFHESANARDYSNIVNLAELLRGRGHTLTAEEERMLRIAQPRLRRQERALAEMQAAIETNDDERIYQASRSCLPISPNTLSEKSRKRIDLARERVQIWDRLEQALEAQDFSRILHILASHRDRPEVFEGSSLFNSQSFDYACWRDWGEAVEDLRNALKSGDEGQVVKTYDRCLSNEPSTSAPSSLTMEILTASQRHQLNQARKLATLRRVKNPASIIKAGKEARDAGVWLSDSDWAKIDQAEKLMELRAALDSGDDSHVISLLIEDDLFVDPNLPELERRQGLQVLRRNGALVRLGKALASGDEQRIRYTFDPILLEHSEELDCLTPDEQRLLEQAIEMI